MKIVFFGTPDYVVPILDTLHKSFKQRTESPVAAVVTQAPKLVGREQVKTFSPVDKWAYGHKKPIYFNPIDVVNNNIQADIGVLASYGKIIPEAVIKHFRHGIINIHPSLLPLWRGSSPIQASIVSGEKTTGVSFMKLDPLLDHGPIISQFKDEITESDTFLTLRTRLFNRASEAFPSLIRAYIAGKTKVKEQDHNKATFTRQLKKEDGFIPPEILSITLQEVPFKDTVFKGGWEIPWIKNYSLVPNAYCLERFIRAMDPWPGAWTQVKISGYKDTRILRLKILKAHLEKTKKLVPSAYYLVPDLVQLEGKSPVSWKQFCEGYPNFTFQ